MHVLQSKRAAIGALQNIDDLAHAGKLQAEHVINKDWPIHIGFFKAIRFWL